MVTAVLPLYLDSIGLGFAALGAMEGAADLAFSLSKLAGGAVGHRVQKKRPWATAGYFLTMAGTGAIALVKGIAAVATLRTVAWFGRGFRSPMRDFMLADEVGPTHFGRAYGFERSADMIGAVLGPVIAAVLVFVGLTSRARSQEPDPSDRGPSFGVMTRDRAVEKPARDPAARSRAPRVFWLSSGVLVRAGDFSHVLIVIAAGALGGGIDGEVLTTAVLLYAGHNLISAFAAYPAGKLGDARSKSKVLVAGYALGVVTNATLAFAGDQLAWVVVAIALSGIYIAIEETLEKAVVASVLPREQRSLGLGILASANALGDLGSSVFVGVMLAAGHSQLAFATGMCRRARRRGCGDFAARRDSLDARARSRSVAQELVTGAARMHVARQVAPLSLADDRVPVAVLVESDALATGVRHAHRRRVTRALARIRPQRSTEHDHRHCERHPAIARVGLCFDEVALRHHQLDHAPAIGTDHGTPDRRSRSARHGTRTSSTRGSDPALPGTSSQPRPEITRSASGSQPHHAAVEEIELERVAVTAGRFATAAPRRRSAGFHEARVRRVVFATPRGTFAVAEQNANVDSTASLTKRMLRGPCADNAVGNISVTDVTPPVTRSTGVR
jgi:MFS family permease